MRLCVVFLGLASLAQAGAGSDLAKRLAEIELDPEECYRVRDITLIKEDLRLYLTDGHLIFGKPVGEVRTAAVFVADIESGDAEILLFPPNKSERQSMATHSGAPNLNEHFKAAVFIFADDTHRALAEQIRSSAGSRKRPDAGLLLAPAWQAVVRNLSASFESRLALDLLSTRRQSLGFFFAAITGNQIGNFDVIYDPRGTQQIVAGQTHFRDERLYFDTWTAFEARSVRNRTRASAPPEFELKDFRITATIDPPPQMTLRAVTKVKLKPGSTDSVFPFDLTGRMRVTAATVDGKPAEILQRESLRSNLIRNTGNDLFLLISPEPLQAGREYEVEIHHEGAVISDAGNKVYAMNARGNWHPARGLQFALFDLTFRYPKDLDLVSTGEIVSDDTQGEQRVTRRKTSLPVRLAGFNLGHYERARITRGGNTVEVYANRTVERALLPRAREVVTLPPFVWAPPRQGQRRESTLSLPSTLPMAPSPTARLEDLASEVASALEFMSARFGPPPVRTLTVSPVPGAFGQGFPGLIYLSTLSYLKSEDRVITRMGASMQTFFSEILHAHEVAHQWWGNVVISPGYQDDWLMESLANYSALMHLEKRKGPRALESLLELYRSNLLFKDEKGRTIESAGPIALGTRLYSSQTPQAWRTITYEKGSWILHMLRRRMGDERFNALLGELRRRYEWKTLSVEEFRRAAAEFLPPKSPDPKLEAFFDQWVYSTGIPALQLKYSVKGKAPAIRLTGTVSQSEVSDEFSVLAPVEVQFGKAKPITHWVRTGSEDASFTLTLRQPPTKVALDPSAVLAIRK